MDLSQKTMEEVCNLLKLGWITADDAEAYVREWNDSGKHFTRYRVQRYVNSEFGTIIEILE